MCWVYSAANLATTRPTCTLQCTGGILGILQPSDEAHQAMLPFDLITSLILHPEEILLSRLHFQCNM
jgi:hypothetical protein